MQNNSFNQEDLTLNTIAVYLKGCIERKSCAALVRLSFYSLKSEEWTNLLVLAVRICAGAKLKVYLWLNHNICRDQAKAAK